MAKTEESFPLRILIATGVLTWEASERRSDRYGYVGLMHDGGNSLNAVPMKDFDVPGELIGKPVRLIAKVIETRQSTHIGDLFRGVYPRTPLVGEAIVLGVGLFSAVRNSADTPAVGVIPDDAGAYPWLDTRALYDVHEQTVELIAELVSPVEAAPDA